MVSTGEMLELIQSGAGNIVCTQPFACLPNHVVGKGVIKELRRLYPHSNIVAIDFDPGASEVNQLNRIKLMLSTANKNLQAELEKGTVRTVRPVIYKERGFIQLLSTKLRSFFCKGDEPKSGLARDLGDCLQSRNVPFGTSGDSF